MNSYYKITEALKGYLGSHPIVNTVVLGMLSDVDIAKHTLYPLAQLIVGVGSFGDNSMTFNVRVLAMDSVISSNADPLEQDDIFKGVDNKQDVYNSMLAVVNGLQTSLKRGTLYESSFELDGFPTATPFEDDFGNLLTGWILDFTIIIPNDNVSACVLEIEEELRFDSTLITFDNNIITF